MQLIAILIAFILTGLLSPGGWRSARGFNRLADWLRQRLLPLGLWNHAGGLIAVVIPALLLVLLVQWLAGGWLFGLVGGALGVIALLFAFGGGETLEAEVAAFTSAWRRGDEAAAQRALEAIAGSSLEPVPLEVMPELAAEHLVIRARTRWFSPVFWFVVLGPVGAFGYRLVVLARAFGDFHDNTGPGYCQCSARLITILDWLPNRLMALALALVGHFNATRQAWAATVDQDEQQRLSSAGLGALGLAPSDGPRDLTGEAVGDTHAMLRRGLYVWLAAIAAATLLGLL